MLFLPARRILPPEELYVLIATHNHEAYIAQAIEGALMQKVDLPLKIIIRDDASTDNTSTIVGEYASRFPDLITLIRHKENQYSLGHGWMPEMAEAVRSSSRVSDWGNIYVALCEGDDYWTDPHKLQRQVNVLRRRPDVDLVHHAVDIIVEPGANVEYRELLITYLRTFEPPKDWPGAGFFSDRHNVMTCSAVGRFAAFDLEEMTSRPAGLLGDWILFYTLTSHVPPVFLDRKMAIYRIHPTSTHSSTSQTERDKTGGATKTYLDGLNRELRPGQLSGGTKPPTKEL